MKEGNSTWLNVANNVFFIELWRNYAYSTQKKSYKKQKKQPPITTNQCQKLPNCNISLQAQENQRHDEYELQSWWIKV